MYKETPKDQSRTTAINYSSPRNSDLADNKRNKPVKTSNSNDLADVKYVNDEHTARNSRNTDTKMRTNAEIIVLTSALITHTCVNSVFNFNAKTADKMYGDDKVSETDYIGTCCQNFIEGIKKNKNTGCVEQCANCIRSKATNGTLNLDICLGSGCSTYLWCGSSNSHSKFNCKKCLQQLE